MPPKQTYTLYVCPVCGDQYAYDLQRFDCGHVRMDGGVDIQVAPVEDVAADDHPAYAPVCDEFHTEGGADG